MTGILGYRRFAAHGSDLGAGVTARLARAHPEAVAAIHLATPGLPPPPRPWSEPVSEHFREADAWTAEEGGYAHMHATKPATIGAALEDSPAGLAAWIGEKLITWSSTTPDGQPGLQPGTAAVHAHFVLGDQDSRILPAAVLGIPARSGGRPAGRRPRARACSHRHLRRRDRPVPQAPQAARRTVLHNRLLGRARPGRPLPRRGRAVAASTTAPREPPALPAARTARFPTARRRRGRRGAGIRGWRQDLRR